MASLGRYRPTQRAFPKLYNAKRRIEVSRGLLPSQLGRFRKFPHSDEWRDHVSPDVVEFVNSFEEYKDNGEERILTNELLPREKAKLFQDPAKYFSRPHNVPDRLRQQVHFPNFGITFLRTPHLGPRYAQFEVPLWFGKLDLKSYLKNLYNVEVSHIRSFVVHQKAARRDPPSKFTQGRSYQPTYKKKMTVELVEPFIWPEEPKESELNNVDHQKKDYWNSSQASLEEMKKLQSDFPRNPDFKHRRSIAEQARALLAGKEIWKPTWQELLQEVRVLQGRNKTATATAASLPGPTASPVSPEQ